jgi:DEAD/DEAH box helicase domain-containing protein
MSDSQIIDPRKLVEWPINSDQVDNIVFATRLNSREPEYCPFPTDLMPEINQALQSAGIHALYSHQNQAWSNSRAGLDQVIVAGTAGGKSLAYQLPVFDSLVRNPSATALFIFPTKALTQDQLTHLHQYLDLINPEIPEMHRVHPAIFDGDTPVHHRRSIREKSRLLLTNPDMLHTGILPHNPQWSFFLGNLKWVILDEVHAYRGVFGSHVANVIRRLNRICAHYGSHPQYIMTSATIGNPQEHASAMIGKPVELVDNDGSGHGARTFCIYNPPLSNPELGIRKSAIFESIHLLHPLLKNDIQTIVFGRARRTVELFLNYLLQLHPEYAGQVSAYRGGYLPQDRRLIEKKLREKGLKSVISTNALELGVDIGSMDASILVGYPGTLASTMQQIGRAGRQAREALSILVSTADPVDQYLAHHPDYFLGLSPEKALINPDHLVILLNHIQCAAYELPFKDPPEYGNLPPDLLRQFLQILIDQGQLQAQADQLYWMTGEYPAAAISLRNSSADQVILKVHQGAFISTIGIVDKLSSYWMVHPQAIYLQDGKTYFVENLDLEKSTAELVEVQEDYYTEAQKAVDIQVLATQVEEDHSTYQAGFGDLNVDAQVKGYKKIKYFTHEQLGLGQLEMPVVSFPTTGAWLVLKPDTVEKLRDQGLWLNDQNNYGPEWPQIREAVLMRDQYRCRNCGAYEKGRSHHIHHMVPFKAFTSIQEANQLTNLITLCPTCHRIAEVNLHMQSGMNGIAFALRNLAPLFVMCDINDMEVHIEPQSASHADQPAITIYDEVPGGIGLSRAVFDAFPQVLGAVRGLIRDCGCASGCPSCIGPAGENGYGGKQEALAILDLILQEDING